MKVQLANDSHEHPETIYLGDNSSTNYCNPSECHHSRSRLKKGCFYFFRSFLSSYCLCHVKPPDDSGHRRSKRRAILCAYFLRSTYTRRYLRDFYLFQEKLKEGLEATGCDTRVPLEQNGYP